jgi:hypothetical protein
MKERGRLGIVRMGGEEMERQRTERGQGILEMVLILPVLLLLMVGVAEIGFGLRNYLLVVNADRESARFAARGRYDDTRVAERVISAGGVVRLGGTQVPFLRTEGTDPNTGIIITHVIMNTAGDVISHTVRAAGVVPMQSGEMRPIGDGDTRISLGDIRDRHGSTTANINATREAAMYEPIDNHVVAVELFFAHEPLMLGAISPVPDPWPMYARTVMRVTRGR